MTTRRSRWVWAVLLCGLLGMLPGLVQRVQIESANRTYELSITYSELVAMRLGGVPLKQSLEVLREAGLGSVGVDMQTIRDLERDGRATLLDRAELLSLLLASGEPPSALPADGDAFLVLTRDDPGLIDRLRRAGRTGEVTRIAVGGQELYQIAGIENVGMLPIGYDDDLVGDLVDQELAVIAHVPDTVASLEFATQELDRLRRDFGIDRFQLVGATAPFATDPSSAAAFIEWLRANDFCFVFRSVSADNGTAAYAAINRAIQQRLVGISPDAYDRPIIDAVRSVRERSTRIITMRAQPALTAADRLDLVVRGMHDIQTAAPEGFAIGVATPMDPIAPTPLHVAATTVAAGAVAAAATMPAGAIVGVGAGFAVAMLAAASAITGSGVLGDLARLAVAGLAAVLATFVARPAPSLPRMTVEYLKVVAMLLIGGLTVAGLAFDRSFMAGTQPFWGVKALLLGPAAIAMLVAAYLSLGRPRLADALPTINLPVRIWHLIALAVGIVAVGFMVLRSGNSMIEIDVELVLREQLEDLFVVRPRTKEFLIGFPALVAGILVAWRSRHGWWLYAVAAIGTASAINTFTHFHSPLLISIARTLIGLGLGYLVGLVLLAAVVAAGRALRRLSLLEAR